MRESDIFQRVREVTHGNLEKEVYQEIYNCGRNVPEGIAVNIGAEQSGSTISLCMAAGDGGKIKHIYNIDTFCKSQSLKSNENIEKNKEKKNLNLFDYLSQFNMGDEVTALVAGKVDSSLDKTKELISILFIDADGALDRDFNLYYNRVIDSGIIIIDDYKEKIDIKTSTIYLKLQNEGEIDCYLKSRKVKSLADCTPFGKQYTTFAFVNYLLENNYIKLMKKIDGTLFAVKPINAPVFTEKSLIEMRQVREKIATEFFSRHEKTRLHYDKIGDYIPMLAKLLNMNHAVLYENNYYETKNKTMMTKIHEWHSNGKLHPNAADQSIELDFFKDIVGVLKNGEPFICDTDQFENKVTRTYLQNMKIELYVCVPIIINNNFWGTIFYSKMDYERNIINDINEEFNSILNKMKSCILERQDEINILTVL